MMEGLVIEPMAEEFIVWRCLHFGPLSCSTIDKPPDNEMSWERYRERNIPLLRKLTQMYGACAIVARDGDDIAGQLRFYPRAVWDTEGAGYLCLQQDHPMGPEDNFVERDFPPLEQLADKALVVHCMMTASPQQENSPYKRKGIGTRMVETLIRWAKMNGWDHIEADAFEDLPSVYGITGSAGHTFWEKLGFRIAERRPHPHIQEAPDFFATLEEEAHAAGIDPERAKDQIIMRLDLK